MSFNDPSLNNESRHHVDEPFASLGLTARDAIAIGSAAILALLIIVIAIHLRATSIQRQQSLAAVPEVTSTSPPPWAIAPSIAQPSTATIQLHTATSSPTASPSPTATATLPPTSTPTATASPTATPLPTATPTPGPPPAAELLQPTAGSIVDAAPVTLSWSTSPTAEGYRLSIWHSDGTELLSRDYAPDACNANGCQAALDTDTISNDTYTWVVESWNELGETRSIEQTFTLAVVNLPTFELGGQANPLLAHPDLMHQAGMRWVKFQVPWPGMGIAQATTLVERGHAQGFKVLLSVKGPLYPESIDATGYVAFLREVARAQPDGIEVWNEMNLNTEWPEGQIDPSAYVQQMLAPAYTAIKTTSPNTIVITGALASTGVHDGVRVWSDAIYAAGMARAGAARYADCIGFHYNAGTTSPRATEGHPADPGEGHYSWYFGPTVELYRSVFPGQPLCLTEIGYLSGDGYPPLPPDWQWAAGTSAELQAQWLAESVDYVQELGGIPIMIVWNVDFEEWEPDGDPQAGFAILRPDGSCPACDRLGPLAGVQ